MSNNSTDREIYMELIPVITDSELEATKAKAEEGDALACIQIMHYAIFKMETDDWSATCMKYLYKINSAKDEYTPILESLGSAFGQRVSEQVQRDKAAEKDTKFEEDPHYTADGKKPNAVLIPTEGNAKLIYVEDFDSGEGLGEPLDCERVDRVMNRLCRWAEDNFGTNMVGYVDSNGMFKGLEENERIQMISGYDYIAGDCVVCAMDDRYNYIPLHPADAVAVWKHFNK